MAKITIHPTKMTITLTKTLRYTYEAETPKATQEMEAKVEARWIAKAIKAVEQGELEPTAEPWVKVVSVQY